MSDTLIRDQTAYNLSVGPLDDIVADLYEYLITMSWESSDTFDEYQDAWKKIAKALRVKPFDWTSGERPRSMIGVEGR